MGWRNRIVIDPEILVGKPVIKGTRLAVELIVGLLAQGWSEAEILQNYPDLTREDILACLSYASDALHVERWCVTGRREKMKIEYDPTHDLLNIEFIAKESIAESVELDGVIIDYSKDGRIVSIEILDAGRRTTKGPLDLLDLTIVKEKEAGITS